jgi:hypothetical protein
MSGTEEWLKYVAQKAVVYLTTPAAPKESRRAKPRKESWATRWFGTVLPAGLVLWWRERRKSKPHAPGS